MALAQMHRYLDGEQGPYLVNDRLPPFRITVIFAGS
jgi:hypothetical protein